MSLDYLLIAISSNMNTKKNHTLLHIILIIFLLFIATILELSCIFLLWNLFLQYQYIYDNIKLMKAAEVLTRIIEWKKYKS